MKRRSFNIFIFTLALIFISALIVVFGGVSINNFARSVIVANAADSDFYVESVQLRVSENNDSVFPAVNFRIGSNYSSLLGTLPDEDTKLNTIQCSRYLAIIRADSLSYYSDSKTIKYNLSDIEKMDKAPETEFTDRSIQLYGGKKSPSSYIIYLKDDAECAFDMSYSGFEADKECYYFVVIIEKTAKISKTAMLESPVEYKIIAKTSNYIKSSFAQMAYNELHSGNYDNWDLNNSSNVKYLQCLMWAARYDYSNNYINVPFKYRKIVNDNADTIEWVTDVYQIPNLKSLSENYVKSQITALCGKSSLSDFNVIRREVGYTTSDPNSAFLQDEYTLLEAEKMKYTSLFNWSLSDDKYDENTTYSVTHEVAVEIEYTDFNAKDFTVIIRTNDTQNSVIFLRSADISKSGNVTTIRFDTSNLETRLVNNFGWETESANFDNYVIHTSGAGTQIKKEYETASDGKKYVSAIVVTTTDTQQLIDCSVRLEIEVVPPIQIPVILVYTQLNFENGEIIGVEKTQKLPDSVWSNKFKQTSFVSVRDGNEEIGIPAYGNLIESALHPAGLVDMNGELNINYLTFSGIRTEVKRDETSGTGKIIVLYTGQTLFKVTTIRSKTETYFVPVKTTKLDYKGSELCKEYTDWRIKSIITEKVNARNLVTISTPENKSDNWKEATISITCQLSENNIIPLTVTYTDKWKVQIEYLKDYTYTPDTGEYKGKLIKSGFAQKKKGTYEVKLAAFKDIYNPTESELKSVMNVQSLTVIGELGKVIPFIDDDNGTLVKQGLTLSSVTFENEVYYIKLSYYPTTIEVVQSTGNYDIISNIPLASFGSWADDWGYDWSVMALNTPGNTIFKSQGDVNRYDLYGYFYVTVFKEQVKNLDTLFAGYTSEGCKTFYDYRQVNGSVLYKFLSPDNLGHVGTVLVGGVGALVRATEEMFNDQAGTYYSYFTYIDGTSSNPYAGNNNSDGFGDHDSAGKNTFDDITDQVKDNLSSLWNRITTNKRIEFIFWAIIGLIGYVVAYKFITLTGLLSQPMFKWIWFGLTIVLLGIALYFGFVAFGAAV